MRIATFNVQNLRLRSRDGQTRLDGAFDRDASEADRSGSLAMADRIKTAKIIAAAQADVVALQEVFDNATLDFFYERFLAPARAGSYDYRYCKKGNDGSGLNVAALSRQKARQVQSHAYKTGADLGLSDLPPDLRDHPIFRRDCLEIHLDTVTLFICHFKAPYPDPAKAYAIRVAEARAVRRIIEACFPDPSREWWVILGDFNEPVSNAAQGDTALDVLRGGFSVDLLDRLQPGQDWTYEVPETHLHTRPDRILASPALAQNYPDARPRIVRAGMKTMCSSVNEARASDHALVFVDFPGL